MVENIYHNNGSEGKVGPHVLSTYSAPKPLGGGMQGRCPLVLPGGMQGRCLLVLPGGMQGRCLLVLPPPRPIHTRGERGPTRTASPCDDLPPEQGRALLVKVYFAFITKIGTLKEFIPRLIEV